MLEFAAILMFLLGLAHSILGERYILVRLFRRDNLPNLFGGTQFTQQTLRFAWHITTIAWWGFAIIVWQVAAGQSGPASTLKIIGYTSIAAGLLPLILTRGRHLSWLVLFAIGWIALSKAAG